MIGLIKVLHYIIMIGDHFLVPLLPFTSFMVFDLEEHLPFLVQPPLFILQGIDLLTVDILFERAFLKALLGNLKILFLIV